MVTLSRRQRALKTLRGDPPLRIPMSPHVSFPVFSVDPLAERYASLLEEEFGLRLADSLRPRRCRSENLSRSCASDLFGSAKSWDGYFDLSIISNALDHSESVIEAWTAVLNVAKIGGVSCVWGGRREAENVRQAQSDSARGFHQWNFDTSPEGEWEVRRHSMNKTLDNYFFEKRINMNRLFQDYFEDLRVEYDTNVISRVSFGADPERFLIKCYRKIAAL